MLSTGTGKTLTGSYLAYFFAQLNTKLQTAGDMRPQVLYCGPSNKSVDVVAGGENKIMILLPKKKKLRLNAAQTHWYLNWNWKVSIKIISLTVNQLNYRDFNCKVTSKSCLQYATWRFLFLFKYMKSMTTCISRSHAFISIFFVLP